MRRTLSAALCAVLALSGCARTLDGTPVAAPVPDAQLTVIGDSGGTFDTEAKNALSDVFAFWKDAYPKIADGRPLKPLKGGLYSIDGRSVLTSDKVPADARGNACLKRAKDFIVDNAAYCSLDDSVLWDRSSDHLLPLLAERYGSAVTALVFAHEFGHAIQDRVGLSDSTPTIDSESQADCAAGAFIAAAMKGGAPHFRLTPADVDSALLGFLQIRDSTPESPEDISHGNGFDRLNALQQGVSRGVTYCYGSTFFDDRQFTERPYDSQYSNDALRGGNEPLKDLLTPGDGTFLNNLNDFWTQAGTIVSRTFDPVRISEADRPACLSGNSAAEFGYCESDNTVYYSTEFADAAYNSLTVLDANPKTGDLTLALHQPADYALGMMFAIGWGLAARAQFFGGSTSDSGGLIAAICYAGAYTEDVNTSGTDFVLSPPDMDEATSAVLTLVNRPDAFGARGTTGLQRVTAFVDGYTGGLQSC